MSAWVVEKEHVDVLLAYGLSDPANYISWRIESDEPWSTENVRRLDYTTADAVGLMLWTENVASVCHRYDSDTADDYAEVFGYTFADPHYVLTPGEALNAVACLEYQSCEHDGWADSEAKRCLDAIQAKAVSKLSTGPWGWDKAALADKPKAISLFGMMQP